MPEPAAETSSMDVARVKSVLRLHAPWIMPKLVSWQPDIMVDAQGRIMMVEVKTYAIPFSTWSGSGKSGSLLSLVLELSNTQTAIRRAQQEWTAAVRTQDLLASVEEVLRFSGCRRVVTVHDPCGMPVG